MFLDTVRQTIGDYRMVAPGERILVGVSAGPDSTALLISLAGLRKEFSLHLEAAYVNHGARPKEVGPEIAFVRAMGKRLRIPLHVALQKIKRKGGESWEARARLLRYEALTQVARKRELSTLALGHTQDDQAETVLLWILRGTGTSGLAGIPPTRKTTEGITIIRPLIRSSRREIERFLRDHGVWPLLDSSNRSGKFLRNRVRHELLPLLARDYNPKIGLHLAQLAEIVRQDLDFLRSRSEEGFRKAVRPQNGAFKIDRKKLAALPAALRNGIFRLAVLRLRGDSQGFSHLHWSALEKLAMDGRSSALDLPGGLRGQPLGERWILLGPSGKLKRVAKKK